MQRRRLATGLAAVVLVAVTAGAVVATQDAGPRRDPVAAAVDAVPAVAVTVDVTVWSRIAGSYDDAALRDVATRSTIAGLGEEMEDVLGWGPRDLAWESHALLPEGSVVVLSLDSVSTATVAEAWNRVGDRVGDLTWDLGDADVSAELATAFPRVRLLRSSGLLVAGPPSAVAAVVDTVEGRTASVLDDRSASAVVRAIGDPASVLLQERVAVCSAEPLDDASADDVRQVEQDEGPLADPRWVARALDDAPRQRLVFAAAFASPAQARAQLTVREALASGPFIGRTGRVRDSLRDLRAGVDGAVTTLDFALTPEAESFMTATGPVVFNGCGVPSPA